MKAFSKLFLMLALILCVAVGMAACDSDDIKVPDNTTVNTADTTADTSPESESAAEGDEKDGFSGGADTDNSFGPITRF